MGYVNGDLRFGPTRSWMDRVIHEMNRLNEVQRATELDRALAQLFKKIEMKGLVEEKFRLVHALYHYEENMREENSEDDIKNLLDDMKNLQMKLQVANEKILEKGTAEVILRKTSDEIQREFEEIIIRKCWICQEGIYQ